MRLYESMMLFVPSLDAKGVQTEVTTVKELITSHGGEVAAEKDWGRRRLAYPIRDFLDGSYYILRFTLGNEGLIELQRRFKLNENVLRYLVLRDEGTPIEYVSQPGESEERDDDYRDRRGSSWESRDSRDSRDSRESRRPREPRGEPAFADAEGSRE